MGFWSSVGSFCSSVCSAIGSAIGSVVSGIGSALSAFASGVGVVIGSVISALSPIAEGLGKFANAFLQGLGILKPNETTQDLGDRALQAKEQGITMEKFDDFDQYMAKLRDFDVDAEASKKYSAAEKLVAGLGVGTIAVEKKYQAEPGSLDGMWLLPMANPSYFTPERMQTLVENRGRLGADVFSYLEKKLAGSEMRSLEKSFEINADGSTLDPTEKDSLYTALDNACATWADLGEQIKKVNTSNVQPHQEN